MPKKLVKYAPMILALWGNPEVRRRVVSTAETVDGKLQSFADEQRNLVGTHTAQNKFGVKTGGTKSKLPPQMLETATKLSSVMVSFLVKQDAKATASNK